MTFENARFKNSGNDEGDVLNFFDYTLRNMLQRNGGDNTFSTFSEEFHEKDIPLPIGEKTHIMLTHPNHTISQIEKSFISMEIEFEVGFENLVPWGCWFKSVENGKDADGNAIYETVPFCENQKIHQIFVGLKDAVEIISEVRFFCDGKLINEYYQNEMIRESFAYNSIRTKDSKITSPHSHSLWENVCQMSPNVCGCYIPIQDLVWTRDGRQTWKKINMELIIPFTDQLVLQAWRLYPNAIIGEIIEEIRTSLDGLVWCQLSPKKVAEIQNYLENDCQKYCIMNDPPLSQKFVQIGQEGKIIISQEEINSGEESWGKSSSTVYTIDKIYKYSIGKNTLMVNQKVKPMIKKGRTNCFGFGIKPETVDGLMELFNEELYVPAQELTRHIFEQKHTEKGLICSKIVPLRNATNITMMFPRHYHDITCFQNPMYKNVQLLIDKKVYPQQEFENTWDGRFVQYQLYANELDGVEATTEFIESISRPLNNIYDHSLERFSTGPFDNTSFGLNFQLERGNAGYVFDGIDTGCRGVKIEFHGDRIDIDENVKLEENDTYLYPVCDENDSPKAKGEQPQLPPPEMWICSDTYWSWSAENGVEYHKDGVPIGYE